MKREIKIRKPLPKQVGGPHGPIKPVEKPLDIEDFLCKTCGEFLNELWECPNNCEEKENLSDEM